MSNRKRILLVILIVLALIVVVAAVAWFAIVPGIIHSKLEDVFEQAEAKTGRHIAVSEVSLRSLKRVMLKGVSISDVNDPQSEAIKIDSVELSLAHIPGMGEIRLSYIDVGVVEVRVTRDGGHYNFDDVRQLLSRPEEGLDDDEEKKEEKEEPTWKQYLTPLPDVDIASILVEMPSLEVMPSVVVTDVNASDVQVRWLSDDDRQQLVLTMNASATFDEAGKKIRYSTFVDAEVASSSEGRIMVMMPRNAYGEIPAPFRPDSYVADAEAFNFILPTTISLVRPKIDHGTDTLFKAEELRVQLMAIPPKKVSGVYIKEFELKTPVVQLSFSDESNDVKELLSTFRKALGDRPQSGEKQSDPKPSPKKRTLTDYYFSQRFFVSDGAITLRDLRKNARGDVRVDHLSLESGYRGIRKVVDYNVEVVTTSPVASKVELAGEYDMKDQGISASFDVDYVNANDATLLMQKRLREMLNTESPDNEARARVNTLERFFASLDLKDATGHARASLTGNFESKQFSIHGAGKSTGVSYASPLISVEPLSLDVSSTLSATLDLADQPVLNIKKLKLEREGAFIDFNGIFSREHVVKQKMIGREVTKSEYDSWNYKFTLALPDQPAQSVFNAIPHALRSELDGLTVLGNIGFTLDVDGRMDAIHETNHKFVINKSPDFSVTNWPVERDINKLNTGFLLELNDPNALTPHEIVVPPSIYPVTKIIPSTRLPVEVYTPKLLKDDIRFKFPEWVLFEDLNPWLVQLITTTEDGSFFTHEGFSAMQIKAALAKNVQRGEFNRGASTLSMQLTKNVFFDRTKSLARKAQEALYTWLMETELSIPKQRIMEIYFNIIEFGPEIYGIEEAAKYYFGKRSEALSLKEAAFLVAIIPAPRRGEAYRRQGSMPKGLAKTVDFYIREMYRRKCSPEMLAKMHARFAKKNMPVPFEPCCPSESSLALMQQQDVKFYLPDPANPLEYGFDPALYSEDGKALVPIHRTCGYNDASPEGLDSIFEVFDDPSLPASDDVRD